LERFLLHKFKLISEFEPQGDQLKAIEALVKGIKNGKQFQTLLGVTGSGKSLDHDEPIIIINQHGMIEKIKIGEFVENRLTSPRRVSDSLYQEIEGFSTVSFNPITFQLEHKEIIEISKHQADLIYEIILVKVL